MQAHSTSVTGCKYYGNEYADARSAAQVTKNEHGLGVGCEDYAPVRTNEETNVQVRACMHADAGGGRRGRQQWRAVPYVRGRHRSWQHAELQADAVAVLLAGSGPTQAAVTPIAIMCALLASIHEHVWHALRYSTRPKLSYVPALLQCTVATTNTSLAS